MRSGVGLFVALLSSLVCVPIAAAQLSQSVNDTTARRYYFHRPSVNFGSASMRGPLGTFVDRGLSIAVINEAPRDLGDIQWASGWESVTDAFAHPGAAIERFGGWRTFLTREFLPVNGKVWRWAWAPNYGGHILAGGITYRYLAEWFDDYDVPAPRFVAGTMSMAMMVANEVLENPDGGYGRAGTLADLIIFDPLGILVFSFDTPAKFVSETLRAADWSPQAAITFPDGRISNHGQLMSYKVPLPLLDEVRLLLLIGQGAATGAQFPLSQEHRLGVVAGFEATERDVDPVTGEESIRAKYGGGVYLDRDNSLLASITLGQRHHTRYSINIYPGVLPGLLKPAGVWATGSQDGEWSVGVAYRRTGGLGTGWDIR